MKNVRLLLVGLAVVAAAGGAYATRSTHEGGARALAWFEYQPTQPGGTTNPANYHEVASTGCLNGGQLCAIRVEKNMSTGRPEQSALNDVQDEIDAGTAIPGKVVFRP
ncbi:hypothetical protein SAMN04488128_1011168 [Chitinophaga eiseniae]|uniref:Uncharacterized protein n=1 Tax=Chitinophaga eiseniae TaxID=634771 RepID=A0A1T4MLM0_9BACT|nr:hypothetical protein [Chitinophaga eiseniae]SJZ67990.1 hypothetical protein SAMN04488128_1011168 [Chitinophaga eiseniae]